MKKKNTISNTILDLFLISNIYLMSLTVQSYGRIIPLIQPMGEVLSVNSGLVASRMQLM